MNPITNMRNLNKMNDRELEMGLSGTTQSWHNEYKDSAWIFVGGLPYDLTEGDIICVFSQFGEIVHINLVRDLSTGKVSWRVDLSESSVSELSRFLCGLTFVWVLIVFNGCIVILEQRICIHLL